MTINTRYQRQTILDEIGEAGQEKLLAASVLCIGAGGLGCPALLYLAAAGIGHIGIADFDNVEESNLQRQTLYSTDQIGQNKARGAKHRLNALNPEIKIETYEDGLSEHNAETLFTKYDIIIDGSDNFATKYLINDAAFKFQKPFIYAAIQGFEGQVSVFDPREKDAPCYRCLYEQADKSGAPTCAENGIIGAVAGIIGSVQAMEAIKLIIDGDSFKTLTSKLHCIDMRTMRSRTLSIPKKQNCPLCQSDPATIQLPTNGVECTMTDIEQITPDHAMNMDGAYLIDVREQDEWDAGHIEGAQFMPLSALMQNPAGAEIPADKDIVLYCAKGRRSQHAAEILSAQGHKNLKNMIGGYDLWLQECA